MTHHDARLTRRAALKGAAGLVIGFHLPLPAHGQSGSARLSGADVAFAGFAPNAFVRISADDLVTVLIKHIEFGQGPFTGLATLVAEELDADWAQMHA
jgi:isoquinoline 1-oxidoreductase beta subunit